jgi:hypothetical protein
VWAAPTKTPFLFVNFFFAAPSCKEKVAMDVEKPRGYSRLASTNSLPAFLFDCARHKEKSYQKRNAVSWGVAPNPTRF